MTSAGYSTPGEGEGWLARRNLIPLGYLGDEAKTARTFPRIGSTRWSVPGDRARLLADGNIELLGRDSVTINSGGEKIFAEEVERAIAGHPAVYDVVVVGRPSERWGSEVVAVVQLVEDVVVTDDDLVEEAAQAHRVLQTAQGDRCAVRDSAVPGGQGRLPLGESASDRESLSTRPRRSPLGVRAEG